MAKRSLLETNKARNTMIIQVLELTMVTTQQSEIVMLK
jgi:hypothetical protein